MTAPRVHPTAVVEKGAELAEGVVVGPYAVLGPAVRLHEGVRVGAHAVVQGDSEVGPETRLEAHAVLGGPPQDLKYGDERTRLVVGARNRIREGVTINLGTVQGGGVTRIGDDCYLMACSHVAHDCVLGDKVILANNVMLAGHVVVQDGAILNGGVGVHHFTTIGRLSYVGGLSRITKDVPPFTIVEGHPSRVRGINIVGLRRARLTDSSVQAIKEAYRLLYRSDLPTKSAQERLKQEFARGRR
ncbi:MAG: acyl-ACP--UDP-N-acetylglucosamine O-acyltransferase, partial [Planctomycetes bacterium]|nr:acyl-ACP--UDP-N-acetylglucosamine O-acyltransferase [Planctomycetota bacterium]